MRIIEMNWYGCKPGTEPAGEPDDCYTMTETEIGSLSQGDPCEPVSLGDPRIVSVSWSQDSERDNSVNHSALVRIDD